MAIYVSANVPKSPRPLSFSRPFLVHRSKNKKKTMFRNLRSQCFARVKGSKVGIAYRSMFSDSNWLLEPPFLTVNVLRKLTGILELPGMMGGFVLRSSTEVRNERYLKLVVPRRKITCQHLESTGKVQGQLIALNLQGSVEAKYIYMNILGRNSPN
jgi:hypothetical protein